MTQKQKIFSEKLFQSYLEKFSQLTDLTQKEKHYNFVKEWLEWSSQQGYIQRTEYRHYLDDLKASHAGSTDHSHQDEDTSLSNRKNYVRNFLFIVLILLAVLTVFNTYLILNLKKDVQPSLTQTVPSFLPLQATLTDTEGKPIDYKTDIYFSLYRQPEGGSAIYKGECVGENALQPDYDGSFSVNIGSDCGMNPIPKKVFSEYSALYVGIKIGDKSELEPRKLVSGFNSYSGISGATLGTQTNAIPYIQETNSLVFDEESPSITSTLGEFSLEGQSLQLKTTGGSQGNILLRPDVTANTIIAQGNLGVGTYTPSSLITALGNKSVDTIGSLVNLTSEDLTDTSVLELRLGTDSSGRSASFVKFFSNSFTDNDGQEVGKIRLNNGGVVYETTGADFAEYFTLSEKASMPETGTIMTVSTDGVIPARAGDPFVGVVSETAGFIGNAQNITKKNVLLALEGQVDVLVVGSVDNGDYIGLSMYPGVGKKIDNQNEAIGIVIENKKSTNVNCSTINTVISTSLNCRKVRVLIK